jgi:hypothetical protein
VKKARSRRLSGENGKSEAAAGDSRADGLRGGPETALQRPERRQHSRVLLAQCAVVAFQFAGPYRRKYATLFDHVVRGQAPDNRVPAAWLRGPRCASFCRARGSGGPHDAEVLRRLHRRLGKVERTLKRRSSGARSGTPLSEGGSAPQVPKSAGVDLGPPRLRARCATARQLWG